MSDVPSSSFATTLRKIRGRTISVLTRVQHVTGPVISVFVVVHLAAPLAANFGGSPLSSQVMLLGREYYQRFEPLAVFAPLALHLAASILKRILIGKPPAPTMLALTGYSAAFLVLPHLVTHRLTPKLFASPADVDYELPKFLLHHFPLRSALLYSLLTGVVLMHAGEGAALIARRATGKRILPRTPTRIVCSAVAVTAMAGVLVMYRERSWIYDARDALYADVLAEVPFYSASATIAR
ncbi:hypothetical protein BKA62DRAFT_682817 [Auriculariales sp. MPI-PUGE-AT-0066]|nr:hypothetical protein BKA62DRAFT_682817 [Auriculariales sp. MPI-PUGE-AT-0066]